MKTASLISRRPNFLKLAGALLLATFSVAQTVPAEHSFHASKAEVEKVLRDLHAYSGGKLPILDGFVEPQENSLDHYERGYYQYSIQLTSAAANETLVRASARITAWYSDKDNPRSGYRVLPSNGRLEADLFDRLQQELSAGNAASKPTAANSAQQSSLPETPSATANPASVFSSSRSVPPSGRVRAEAANQSAGADDRRIQQLAQETRNLEEIIRNQSHPDNLVSVKSSQTPVLVKPLAGAQVLFLADAEDEFQLVDTTGSWVHVQISGISRGWIERDKINLPGESAQKTPSAAASNPAPDQVKPEAFRPTREETGTFPGNWAELRGKTVRIIWVDTPANDSSPQETRLSFAKALFRKKFPELSQAAPSLAGVVIVFDAEDGGMAAATMAALQQWNAGHLSDNAFWKQCWLDPPDAFKGDD